MAVTELNHPLIKHKMALLRKSDVTTAQFRQVVSEISSLLAYEACRDLPLESYEIDTWQGALEAERIAGKKATLVPILRAGNGMVEGILKLMPNLRISVVGLYRNEETLEPVAYYENLVNGIEDRLALVIDPMLATGGSLDAALTLLKKAGCQNIKALVLVAAPEGIENITNTHPDVDIFTATIDDRLNENGYILPGLGDAGDKIFGTKG
ncbi:MAG: uracil phosphoribosyltransferase [Gammaproteobacteria bacterium]|jgi:uracil phosphoribosyltransferase